MVDGSVLDGKSILVTGGTGSFGRRFIRRALECPGVSKVVVFSRDEWKQWEMRRSDPIFDDPRIRYFLGDVRDRARLDRAFHGIDLVVHAAALKQVPAAEYNPCEFVKTNVHGAMNVIDAAIDAGVDRVIALSTDKAVNPVNLYGATKLCSDKLFTSGNIYVGSDQQTRFAVVRYGNVLGSRGSIIPLWKQMLDDGAKSLPVTDERMTRFWITLEQSVDFVINSFSRMQGGEVFVPKIPSMRIIDLAAAIAPGVPYHVIGIREGEKLHECLIGEDDARHSLEFLDRYVIAPEIPSSWISVMDKHAASESAKTVADGFVYSSDSNENWLGPEELQQVLARQCDFKLIGT